MARVLAVDDDLFFLAMMRSALEQERHEVVTATKGEEAIQLFLNDKFDVLVCDLVLPDVSGLHVIREARHHAPRVAIVAISGGVSQGRSVHIDVLNMAKIVGANVIVKKPFAIPDFIAAVESALFIGSKKFSIFDVLAPQSGGH